MRKCSQCAQTGHNSRTCRRDGNLSRNGQKMKLFGVELASLQPTDTDDHFGLRKRSFRVSPNQEMLTSLEDSSDTINGSLSSRLDMRTMTRGRRKKGVPWNEEEHRLFLLGLEKLGKGDWKGIARNFVTTRTSTQVASHAQKYFLRQNNAKKNKILRSMAGRNEAQSQQVSLNGSSTSVSMFARSFAPNTGYIYSNKTAISTLFKAQESVPYCRSMFNNSALQNSPSLELSLGTPAVVGRPRNVFPLRS